MTKRKPRNMRRISGRRRFVFSKRLQATADFLFKSANDLLEKCGSLDTAMRDTLADGLARIVYVAYDTEASNQRTSGDYEQQARQIEENVSSWFRARGFAEWYCLGAAHCFSRVPPRTRAEMDALLGFRRKRKQAA
jgi:hypothetical protein